MKTLPQRIFEEFTDKIISASYHPTNAIETLKARFTATWLLQDGNPHIVEQAAAFLQKTSTFKEADLLRLQQLAAQTKTWDEFHICSAYTNTAGTFLEYKLVLTSLENRKQTLHFHACYETKDHACYFVSQTLPLIRLIGDPILHQPGILFPEAPTAEQQQELTKQIELAKSALIQTAGAGIAANQCAGIACPYRFTIVGVFYDIPEHAIGVEKRYPNAKFPQAKILVNPVITAVSQETQHFNHGCLSVPCANRCTVASPMEISVTYQDPLEEMREKHITFTGIDAVALWHELTHILSGKTYMDVTFESIPIKDLYQFQKMVSDALLSRQIEQQDRVPCLSILPFHLSVTINDSGSPRLDSEELSKVLPNINDETLAGLLNQAQQLFKKKLHTIDKPLQSLPKLSLYSGKNIEAQPETEYAAGFTMSKL